MHVTSIEIINYKSFRQTPKIPLSLGINVLIGENNTGKTSFVEALSLRFSNQPHRSRETFRPPFLTPPADSTVRLHIAFSKDELYDALGAISPFFIPPLAGGVQPENLIASIGDQNEFVCDFNGQAQQKGLANIVIGQLNSFQTARQSGNQQAREFNFDGRTLQPHTLNQGYARTKDYDHKLAVFVRESIYAFKAERYNLGSCQAGDKNVLSPNASNLAEVLSVLQSHPARWKRFNEYVNTVFPHISAVSVLPTANNTVTIQVWNEDPQGLPPELAISLSESGTGVGQVLSVLAVVLLSDYPRTIIIDEPQSFLHPRALRTLVEILADYREHQFIIATHSPIVISASRPKGILRTVRSESVTQIELLDIGETESLRILLADVGARLSDVFGAERILWVDGETEEACFPEIMLQLSKRRHYGTKILGVKQTGDFEGRHSRVVLDIYSRLSRGEGLLPPAVGFLFDREKRSETQATDMERQGKGKMKFLKRMMFENYLLNAEEIVEVMNSLNKFREEPVSVEEVRTWVKENGASTEFIEARYADTEHENWLKHVHGAKLLARMFQHFSENRYSYNKIEYGLHLTRLILDKRPVEFTEVAEQIDSLLEA